MPKIMPTYWHHAESKCMYPLLALEKVHQFRDTVACDSVVSHAIGNRMDESAIWEKMHGNRKIAQGEAE